MGTVYHSMGKFKRRYIRIKSSFLLIFRFCTTIGGLFLGGRRRSRKSILLKTADNVGMEIENIFDYFNDIKIISNHDGYFYSVKEALKILERYTSGQLKIL